jgi:hypothetical protein
MSQGISYGGIENKTQGSANTNIATNYSHFHPPAHRTRQLSNDTGVEHSGDKVQLTNSHPNIDEYLYKYAVQLVSAFYCYCRLLHIAC